MDNAGLLENAASYFKVHYPGISAEAIVCFLVVVGQNAGTTVSMLAADVHMNELDTYNHLTLLATGGIGLVSLENTGGGDTFVQLTQRGEQTKAVLLSAISSQ